MTRANVQTGLRAEDSLGRGVRVSAAVSHSTSSAARAPRRRPCRSGADDPGLTDVAGSGTLHAAGEPQNSLLSVRITSPLGRLGLPGAIRIVAQVNHPPQLALESVRFYVNDTLVGDDREGPPYAVEWTDANPFEPTRIRVDATDARGDTASDAIELAPFEILEITGVSRVLLEATVMDKSGRFVGGLDAASFRVLEDDEPQTIDLATIESLPVTYTLLVDASQSMHARMEFVRRAAGRLADFLRPNDRIIVAPFAKSLGPITGPTGDRDTVAGAVQAISSRGGTAISDGLIEASRLVSSNDRRHVIVLITDGYDEHSQAKVEDALFAVKSARAEVYVIGVGGIAGISLKGERALRQIAQQTGGRVFFPSREQELPAVHEQVAEDVQRRYLLSYSSANEDADGAWRRITVLTTDPSHRIRTRAGYFAPKPPPVRPSLEFTVTGANRELVDLTRDDLVVHRRRRRPEGGHLPGGRGAGLGRARARCQRQHDQGRRRGQDRGAVVRRGAEAEGCAQRAALLRLVRVRARPDDRSAAEHCGRQRLQRPRRDRALRRPDRCADACEADRRQEGRRPAVRRTRRGQCRHGSWKRADAERRLPRTQGDRRHDLPHRPRTSRRSRISRAAGCRVRRRRVLSGGRLEPARRLRAHRGGAAPPLPCQLYLHECRSRRRVAHRRDQDAAGRADRQEPGRLCRAGTVRNGKQNP